MCVPKHVTMPPSGHNEWSSLYYNVMWIEWVDVPTKHQILIQEISFH